MERYGRVQSVTFGAVELPLPLSVSVRRRVEPASALGDGDAFATSVQHRDGSVAAEVTLRGTAAAEGLALGARDTLTATVGATRAGQAARRLTLTRAVLAAVEIRYGGQPAAVTTVRFIAEADGGAAEPFAAEDVS